MKNSEIYDGASLKIGNMNEQQNQVKYSIALTLDPKVSSAEPRGRPLGVQLRGIDDGAHGGKCNHREPPVCCKAHHKTANQEHHVRQQCIEQRAHFQWPASDKYKIRQARI
jgi:hypothetical protein